MQQDTSTSKFTSLRSRFTSLSKPKQRALFASLAGLGMLLITLIAFGTVDANNKAAKFESDITDYVGKVSNAPTSINGMKPIVSEAPTLPSGVFTSFSGSYKKAAAKQAVLDVHQQEVFYRVTAFVTDTQVLRQLSQANIAFLRSSELGGREDLSLAGQQTYYKNRADKTIQRLKTYRNSVGKADFGAYGQLFKQDYFTRLDRAIAVQEQFKREVSNAQSLAAVRSADFKTVLRSQSADANAGQQSFNAARSAYQQPFTLIRPAVTSLKRSVAAAEDQSADQARVAAYRSLYGQMATDAIPQSKDTANREQRTGLANYALTRLQAVAGDEDELARPLGAALTATNQLAMRSSDAGSAPSGAWRATYLYGVAVRTSSFDGFSDMVANIRRAAAGTEVVQGARFDFPNLENMRQFARDNYPTRYYGETIKEYQQAVDACIDVRVKNHKASEPTINRQIKLGQEAAELRKEVDEINARVSSPRASDASRLVSIQNETQQKQAELTTLDQRTEQLGAEQLAAIDQCGQRLKPAIDALNAKAENLTALYADARTATEALYR